MTLTTADYIAALDCWATEQPVSDSCEALYEALRQTGAVEALTERIHGLIAEDFGPETDRKFILTVGLTMGMGYASDLIRKASETKELENMLRDENGRPWYVEQRQHFDVVTSAREQGFVSGLVFGAVAMAIAAGVLWWLA